MRLDKLVGKACYQLNVRVYDWKTSDLIIYIQYDDFGRYEDYLKKFKVRVIGVSKDKCLEVYVTKKED